jgi:hypothetical protein
MEARNTKKEKWDKNVEHIPTIKTIKSNVGEMKMKGDKT